MNAVDLGVDGVRAGHATGEGTGVTVVLLPAGTTGSAEIRGGAPASRELAVLEPTRTVERVDAVVLTGGSAFGLAAADGVMRFLAERGAGFPTAAGPVPIVPTAAVYDLRVAGDERPDASWGSRAAEAAERGAPLEIGRVGAGRGATVGKWRGADHWSPGGLGAAAAACDGARVAAIAVVNALGDVVDDHGAVVAGSTAPPGVEPFPEANPFEGEPASAGAPLTNTTLIVVVTDARLGKVECRLLAESAHGGLTRAIRPAHTRFDGDVAIAVATGAVGVSLDRLRIGAADVVAAAVRAPFAASRSDPPGR
jgi:L-aminopeptidase/D-esterase-like protein